MAWTSEQKAVSSATRPTTGTPGPSQGLEWLWKHLQDVRQPRILDCGSASPSTIEVLLKRRAKIYVADLIAPALEADPRFWDRSKKSPIFLSREFLQLLPEIPPSSLTVALSWNLFDLLPHEALPAVLGHIFSLLAPLGVLCCILREPYLTSGVERRWWLESPSLSRSQADAGRAFPHPPITNREMERLLPGANIKIFLTRSGRREVLAMRPAELRI
jgi:hypothetical protein